MKVVKVESLKKERKEKKTSKKQQSDTFKALISKV